MIECVRLHRAHNGDVIDYLCHVWQQFRQLCRALTVLGEFELGTQKCSIGFNECGAIALNQIGRWPRTVAFCEFGLVVKHLQLAGSSGHEQIDDSFDFAGKMRLLRSKWVLCRRDGVVGRQVPIELAERNRP